MYSNKQALLLTRSQVLELLYVLHGLMDLTLFTQAKHSFVVHATFIVDNLSQSQALGLVMSILLPISTYHIPSLLRKCEPRARRSIRHIFESSWRQDENEVQSFLSTHQLQSSSNRVLVALWREKTVLALCACSRLITLARTCMSHQAARKRKCFILQYSLVLVLVTSYGMI